jgi:hypothetical protein
MKENEITSNIRPKPNTNTGSGSSRCLRGHWIDPDLANPRSNGLNVEEPSRSQLAHGHNKSPTYMWRNSTSNGQNIREHGVDPGTRARVMHRHGIKANFRERHT